jgi:hypothetical protein
MDKYKELEKAKYEVKKAFIEAIEPLLLPVVKLLNKFLTKLCEKTANYTKK